MISPTSALMLPAADSSETMLTVKQLNLNPSIIVNLEQGGGRHRMLFERDHRVGFSQGRSKKSTNPSSSQGAFYHKRSVNSVQRNVEGHRVIRLNNAAVSQIQLGPTQEMTQFSFSPCNTQQRGFLPKMFKKSNFARTQKAIKMIREGPMKGRGKG